MLCCPVRGCAERLVENERRALVCPRGHSFDRARPGYWNLLQPQDRRSRTPGDSADALAARRRSIDAGLAEPLIDELRRSLRELVGSGPAAVVDLGCGEGALVARVVEGLPLELCGIDLSTAAIRHAARTLPSATWVVANADRRLPLGDGTVDVALSLFGRRNGSEVRRILKDEGAFVVAVPGADDLIELRAAVQGREKLVDRVESTVAALGDDLALVERGSVRSSARLDAHALGDALASTYRGARRRERERSRELTALEVTLSAEVLTFRLRR